MLRSKLVPYTALFSLLALSPAQAHHSFAMFDRAKTDTVAGTVKSLEFSNPHAWLRMMAADSSGRVVEWAFEMGGTGQLFRSGWSTDVVKPGDKVSVAIHPLRDGSYGGQLVSLTLPNGQLLHDGKF